MGSCLLDTFFHSLVLIQNSSQVEAFMTLANFAGVLVRYRLASISKSCLYNKDWPQKLHLWNLVAGSWKCKLCRQTVSFQNPSIPKDDCGCSAIPHAVSSLKFLRLPRSQPFPGSWGPSSFARRCPLSPVVNPPSAPGCNTWDAQGPRDVSWDTPIQSCVTHPLTARIGTTAAFQDPVPLFQFLDTRKWPFRVTDCLWRLGPHRSSTNCYADPQWGIQDRI